MAGAAGLIAVVLWWEVFSLHARLRRTAAHLGMVHVTTSGRTRTIRCRSRRRVAAKHMRYAWSLPPGVTLRDVLNHQEAIEHALDAELVCWIERKRLITEVMRHPIPDIVSFDTFDTFRRPPGRLVIGLGVSRRGPLHVDLAALPHLLVGGMTGGGKSVFLTQMLTRLILDHDPGQLQLVCIDLKGGIELAMFAGTPHALGDVVTTIEAASSTLTTVRSEVDRRLGALRGAGLRDIDGWTDSGRARWPRIVVVVDELAELTVREVGANPTALAAQKAATGRLCEIARLGRAAGIHLIVCTQRPDVDAVPGQLKANLAGTVAFRVRAGVNSAILLDSDRAALLPPRPGRGIWAHERLEEFQAVHLTGDQAHRLIADRVAQLTTEPTGRVTPWVLDTQMNSDSQKSGGIRCIELPDALSSDLLDTSRAHR